MPGLIDWLGSPTWQQKIRRRRSRRWSSGPARRCRAQPRPRPAGPFVGTAADGLITAEAGAEGRVRSVTIDPKMLRRPVEDVCRDVVAAVNAALDARPGRVDTGPLLEELRAVQEQSVQEMAKISSAFSDALAQAIASKR